MGSPRTARWCHGNSPPRGGVAAGTEARRIRQHLHGCRAPVEAAQGEICFGYVHLQGPCPLAPGTNNTTPRRPALCRCGSAGARQCADLRPSVRSATAPKISQARPSEGATSPLFTLFGHETCSTACDGSLGRADSSQPHASTLQTPAVLVLSPGLRPLFCSRRWVPQPATRSLTLGGSAHRLSSPLARVPGKICSACSRPLAARLSTLCASPSLRESGKVSQLLRRRESAHCRPPPLMPVRATGACR